MTASDILIGSHPSVPATTIQVTANAVQENLSFTGGNPYYVDDTSNSWSLFFALETLFNTHSELSGVSIEIGQNGLAQIDWNGVNTSIDSWGSDNTVRDMAGFTGTTTTSTTEEGDEVSQWIWIPGKFGLYDARIGSDGIPVLDTAIGQSGPGTVRSFTQNTRRRNKLDYRYVAGSRVWTTAEGEGEFYAFWDKVLKNFYRFKVYQHHNSSGFVDDTSSSTAWTPANPVPSSGAYIFSDDPPIRFRYNRESGFRHVDSRARVVIDCVTTPEYS